MNLTGVITELRQERECINKAIEAIARLAAGRGKRRGRTPAWLAELQTKRRGRPPALLAGAKPRRRGRPLGRKKKRTA